MSIRQIHTNKASTLPNKINDHTPNIHKYNEHTPKINQYKCNGHTPNIHTYNEHNYVKYANINGMRQTHTQTK